MPLTTSQEGKQCPAAHTFQSNQWFSWGLIFWPFIWYFTENPSFECLQLFSCSLLVCLGYSKVIIKYEGGWSESFYCQKNWKERHVWQTNSQGRMVRGIKFENRWTTVISSRKTRIFSHETVPLYGSTSHFICSLHLCVSDNTWMLLYLHRHSFLRRKLAIVVTAHNSNTLKESELTVTAPGSWARAFFQGKAELLQFYCSFKM